MLAKLWNDIIIVVNRGGAATENWVFRFRLRFILSKNAYQTTRQCGKKKTTKQNSFPPPVVIPCEMY